MPSWLRVKQLCSIFSLFPPHMTGPSRLELRTGCGRLGARHTRAEVGKTTSADEPAPPVIRITPGRNYLTSNIAVSASISTLGTGLSVTVPLLPLLHLLPQLSALHSSPTTPRTLRPVRPLGLSLCRAGSQCGDVVHSHQGLLWLLSLYRETRDLVTCHVSRVQSARSLDLTLLPWPSGKSPGGRNKNCCTCRPPWHCR